MEGRRPMVIDNGSGFLKAGLAGGKVPTVVFPAVVGKRKPRCRRLSLAEQYTGEEAVLQRGNVTLRHPVERGVVREWHEMELVWEHAFQRLTVSPHQQHVLLTESALNPAPNRRRTVETFLETFRAPGVMVVDTPSLCLYASDEGGTTTGLVLESGYSATYAVPIVRGRVVREAVSRLDLGGNDLTVFLLRLVESRGSFFPPAKRELFSEVKEKLCYVAMDFMKEEEAVQLFAGRQQSSGIKQSYNLAGDTITLETERFQCPESLFQPNWLRVDAMGVHHLVHSAIEKCPAHVHHLLYDNIIVTGGSTCFPGFTDRLKTELCRLCAGEYRVHVQAPDTPKTLAWRGGSEFCVSQCAHDKWITLKEYQEFGESILERKRGIFAVEKEDEPERDVGECHSRQESSSRTSHKHVSSFSRSSSRTTTSSTPISSHYKRISQFTPATPTPCASDSATQTASHSTVCEVRGRGLYRTDHSPEKSASGGAGQSSPRSNLTSQKRKDEARPTSTGMYDNKHFHPTLPKTPELGDEEENGAGSSSTRKMSLDFSSLRKMSLFDHLLEEVATFSMRSDLEDGDHDQDTPHRPHHASPLYEMPEEDLLPDHGMSAMTRNEIIDAESLKKASPRLEEEERPMVVIGRGSGRALKVHCLVPVIEITTCPTPHGSASGGSDSEQPSPVDTEPKKVVFKFDE